jgi:hypothetical protein
MGKVVIRSRCPWKRMAEVAGRTSSKERGSQGPKDSQ